MKKVLRGLLLLTLALLIQLTMLPANEAYGNESAISLKELNIKVMPEFINPEEWDHMKPSLLVGYHGTIINESDEPYTGEIIVPVPTNLPEFREGFVAQFKSHEDLEPTPETYNVNRDEHYFSWTPQNPIGPNEEYYFVLEFFSASIEGVVDRTFNYSFTPEVLIPTMNIAFYAPYKAQNFTIDKEATANTQSFGVHIYTYEYKDVKVGEKLDFNVSYYKEDIVTTVDAFNDFNNDEAHAGFNELSKPKEDPPLISTENLVLGIITLVIVSAFAFIIIRNKRSSYTNPYATTKETQVAPKKIVNKEEELKKLRKMLADGLIDEKTYKEKRIKLG